MHGALVGCEPHLLLYHPYHGPPTVKMMVKKTIRDGAAESFWVGEEATVLWLAEAPHLLRHRKVWVSLCFVSERMDGWMDGCLMVVSSVCGAFFFFSKSHANGPPVVIDVPAPDFE